MAVKDLPWWQDNLIQEQKSNFENRVAQKEHLEQDRIVHYIARNEIHRCPTINHVSTFKMHKI